MSESTDLCNDFLSLPFLLFSGTTRISSQLGGSPIPHRNAGKTYHFTQRPETWVHHCSDCTLWRYRDQEKGNNEY